jgi:replicative DNA helicase
MEIGITKNRHGEIGVARCHFDKKQQRLRDIDGATPRRF